MLSRNLEAKRETPRISSIMTYGIRNQNEIDMHVYLLNFSLSKIGWKY